jgi:hypothetical protein
VLDVLRVLLDRFLKCKWHLLGINGHDWHSLYQKFFIKLVVLEQLELHEALDTLLEDLLREHLIAVNLVPELSIANH